MNRTTITVSKDTHEKLSETNPGLTWDTFLLALLIAWENVSNERQMIFIKYVAEQIKKEEPCS